MAETATPWASPDDVRGVWLLDEEDLPDDTKISKWIARAQRLIESTRRQYAPSSQPIAARIAGDESLAETVSDLVVAMVCRVFSNPEGVRSAMDVTGPLTSNVTYGGDDPGTLYVTSKEMASVGVARRRQRAFSVPTGGLGRRSW